MFIAYKYTGSNNGMMIAQNYGETRIVILSVSGGTKTVKSLNGV